VIDRTLTVTQNGIPREVTVEEALQHRTYQDAIAGNRAAVREVLRMIARRERWLAVHAPKQPKVELVSERADPGNADDALLILGIAEPDPEWRRPGHPERRVLLRPWAVWAALDRFGRRRLSAEDMAEIERATAGGADALAGAGCGHEQDG
jgi:hypothetical protein